MILMILDNDELMTVLILKEIENQMGMIIIDSDNFQIILVVNNGYNHK